jgi:hypothetical protein
MIHRDGEMRDISMSNVMMYVNIIGLCYKMFTIDILPKR